MSQSTQSIAENTNEDQNTSPGLAMRLYAVIWWTCFAAFTVFAFLLVCVLIVPSMIFDRRHRIIHVLTTCFWGWSVYAFNPLWSIRVDGREKLPWDGRALFVANHDSLADILVMGALFRPYKFVSKASVFAVPAMGWAMTLLGYVPLRRGDRASVLEMLERCRLWLEKDVPIAMFPEGTRSPDGVVQKFKDGAFQLAIETDSPVFPIVLAGTRDALPKHGLIAPLRSHVRVKVLDPVHPDEFHGNLEALREHVRTVIVSEKARLTESLNAETARWK